MKNGTNIVVTSIYELYYEELRSSSFYKSFSLLTETIQALIFDDYQYVIYTDNFTYEKHKLSQVFNHPNIEIRFKELNTDLYLNQINPIRIKKFDEGEIYDRIYCVKNYIEVILNKLDNVLEVSNEITDGNVIWLDAGLFGTSCHNAWRDYLKDNLVYRKEFLDKIFEKIGINNFIATKGNNILINYELKDRLKEFSNADIKIVPGCLFGGKKESNIEILSGFREVYSNYINQFNELISEQELLSILMIDKNVKFFEFGDWLDLQKAFLQIMDEYDESKYQIDKCYEYAQEIMTEEELVNPVTDREILNEILNLKNGYLNSLDLSHNDDILSKLQTFALYYHSESGREHYRLLSKISKYYNNELLFDVGSNNGCSALALSENPTNNVKTYDINFHEGIQYVNEKSNIDFYQKNVLGEDGFPYNTRFIMLDTDHDGSFEKIFYEFLIEKNYKGLLFLDDIHLNPPMNSFWDSITQEKYDITSIGHNTGSGIVIFE